MRKLCIGAIPSLSGLRRSDPNDNAAKAAAKAAKLAGFAGLVVVGIIIWGISAVWGFFFPDKTEATPPMDPVEAHSSMVPEVETPVTVDELRAERAALAAERARLEADAAALEASRAAEQAATRASSTHDQASSGGNRSLTGSPPTPPRYSGTSTASKDRAADKTQGYMDTNHAVVVNPVWVRRPTPPQYPTRADNAGIEGEATVRCVAGVNGSLADCEAIEEYPGGYGFGLAAVDSVRRAAVRPRTVDGNNYPSIIQTTVRFRLE